MFNYSIFILRNSSTVVLEPLDLNQSNPKLFTPAYNTCQSLQCLFSNKNFFILTKGFFSHIQISEEKRIKLSWRGLPKFSIRPAKNSYCGNIVADPVIDYFFFFVFSAFFLEQNSRKISGGDIGKTKAVTRLSLKLLNNPGYC